jgi:hypothetical protein
VCKAVDSKNGGVKCGWNRWHNINSVYCGAAQQQPKVALLRRLRVSDVTAKRSRRRVAAKQRKCVAAKMRYRKASSKVALPRNIHPRSQVIGGRRAPTSTWCPLGTLRETVQLSLTGGAQQHDYPPVNNALTRQKATFEPHETPTLQPQYS